MIVRNRNKAGSTTLMRAAGDEPRPSRWRRGAAPSKPAKGDAAMAKKTAGSVPPTGARAREEMRVKAAETEPARAEPTREITLTATTTPPDAAKTSGNGKAGAAPKKPRQSIWFRPGAVNVKLIYAGYLASLAMPPVALIAGFFAHQSAKQDPPQWLATHYLYQTRTFWMGLAANIIAYALSFAGVGLLLFPLIAVWLVARSVKGLIRVAQGVEIEEPLSYFV